MKNNFDRLPLLTRDQLDLIHSKTVDVLENTGMWICSERARDIFKKHGFKIKGEIVYFTGKQIESALKTVPSQFTIKARNPKNDVVIGGEECVFSNNAGAPYIMDYQGKFRLSDSKDFHNFLKINQSLDAINITREMVSSAGDINPVNTLLYETLWQMKLTDKPVNAVFPEGIGLLATLFGISKEKMKEGVSKRIGYGLGNLNPRSPLALEASQCERCIELSTYGVPITISPMPMAGMTGPVTLPGLLIAQNAEILGPVVLSQLVNPGAMVIYGILATVTNMKTTVAATAAPEVGIILQAGAQIADFYGMPTRGDVGLSDSNCVDFQAGSESAFHLANAIHSGISIMPGLGSLGSRLIGSFEKLVLDAELVGYAKRMIKPLEFTEESMAVDVIKKVGQKGNYISEQHTFDHFKTEIYRPMVFVQQSLEYWEQNGRMDALTNAHKKVNEILDNYEQPVLEKSIERDLDKYAETHYPGSM